MLNFIVGDIFFEKNTRLKVIAISGKEVVLQHIDHNSEQFEVLSSSKLSEMLQNSDLKKYLPLRLPPVDMTKSKLDKYNKIRPYIEIMERRFQEGEVISTPSAYKEICVEIEKNNPSISYRHFTRSVLCRYFQRYKLNGCLKECFRSNDNQGARADPETMDLLNRSLKLHWQGVSHNNIYGAHKHYCEMVKEYNSKPVSYSTYVRHVHKLPEVDKILQHSDTATKNKVTATRLKKIEVYGLLHRVEIDRCDLDLSLLYPDGSSTGKVSIYAAMDVCSRTINGFSMEIDTSEDTEGVARLLSQLYMCREEAPYTGHIRNIIKDNGPGFKSHITRNILNNLKITAISAPAYTPQAKCYIESFFNVMANHLTTVKIVIGNKSYIGIPGYVALNKKKNKIQNSSDSKARAAIGIEAFKEIMKKFVTDYNHKWVHPDLNMTPNEKWLEQMSILPPIPVKYQEVRHHFHFAETRRKLTQGGQIKIENVVYSSTALAQLYLNLKTTNSDGSPYVMVRSNPGDASCITVYAKLPSGEKVDLIVEHQKWGTSNEIVSFDELKKAPIKRSSLFTVTLNESYAVKPKRKNKQVIKKSHIPSFNENRESGLDPAGVIKRSHLEYDKKTDPTNSMLVQAKKVHVAEKDEGKKPENSSLLFDGEDFF